MGTHPIIVWFRRDLRVADNPALLYAASQDAPVVPVYVVDWEQGRPLGAGQGRALVARGVARAAFGLPGGRGARLSCSCPGGQKRPSPNWPGRIGAGKWSGTVFTNRIHVMWTARWKSRSSGKGVSSRSFNAALLFEPEEHYSRSGRPFVQFTAFWRSCLALPEPAARGRDREP